MNLTANRLRTLVFDGEVSEDRKVLTIPLTLVESAKTLTLRKFIAGKVEGETLVGIRLSDYLLLMSRIAAMNAQAEVDYECDTDDDGEAATLAGLNSWYETAEALTASYEVLEVAVKSARDAVYLNGNLGAARGFAHNLRSLCERFGVVCATGDGVVQVGGASFTRFEATPARVELSGESCSIHVRSTDRF